MAELAGDTRISLEGDLSRCQFTDDLVVSRNETAILKRSTLYPIQDFIVLRLTPESVEPVFKQVMAAGLNRAIIHVQIERSAMLELAAYDNFHRDCVVTGLGVSVTVLDELKAANVLTDFKAI